MKITVLIISSSLVGARQQLKPIKLKRMSKLKDHQIVSSACGTLGTALISNEGKLFMFGNLDEDLTDKSTGEPPCILI